MEGRYLSFGLTPWEVIAKFEELFQEHCTLVNTFQELLARQSRRTSKYDFQPLIPEFLSDWNINVPEYEDMNKLEDALKKLDVYVNKNRLKDKASGIEDLLCGDLDSIEENNSANSTCVTGTEIFTIQEKKVEVPCGVPQNVVVLVEGIEVDETAGESECIFCHTSFSTISALDLHFQQVHNIIASHCVVCSDNFDSNHELNHHYKTAHDSDAIHCPVCKNVFYTKQIVQDHCRRDHLRHLTFNTDGSLKISDRKLSKCEQCDYVALRKGRMSTHLKDVHGILEEIACDSCGKVFPSHRMRQHHFSQFHTMINIACDICGRVCKNRSAFQRHHSMHSQIFNCQFCDKVFRDRRGLLQHEKRHSSNAVFPCTYCGRSFKLKSNMDRHVKVTHLKEGKLMCDSCAFTTFYKEVLKDHIERVHLGVKKVKFTCEYCKKSFSRRLTYDEHMDRHEGRYRHSCTICGKKYRNKARCKLHEAQCSEGAKEGPTSSSEEVKVSILAGVDDVKSDSPGPGSENMDLILTMDFGQAAE